ncbi:MAG: hypothetical protein AAGE52_00125 [Myxococcota bacterium]
MRFLTFFLLLACGRSHMLDPSGAPPTDAGCRVQFDEGISERVDAPLGCEAQEFYGCADSTHQWFWNGRDCELRFDCRDAGHATRHACLEAFAACGVDACSPMDTNHVDACGIVSGYTWTGRECAPLGCCEGPDCPALFPNEASCTAVYRACGIEDRCGPEVTLGATDLSRVTPFPATSDAEFCGASLWNARAVFVAPREGSYWILGDVRIASPTHTSVAVLRGRCTRELRECIWPDTGPLFLREGETITILLAHEDGPLFVQVFEDDERR